jgi:hypothetical protein
MRQLLMLNPPLPYGIPIPSAPGILKNPVLGQWENTKMQRRMQIMDKVVAVRWELFQR